MYNKTLGEADKKSPVGFIDRQLLAKDIQSLLTDDAKERLVSYLRPPEDLNKETISPDTGWFENFTDCS